MNQEEVDLLKFQIQLSKSGAYKDYKIFYFFPQRAWAAYKIDERGTTHHVTQAFQELESLINHLESGEVKFFGVF